MRTGKKTRRSLPPHPGWPHESVAKKDIPRSLQNLLTRLSLPLGTADLLGTWVLFRALHFVTNRHLPERSRVPSWRQVLL